MITCSCTRCGCEATAVAIALVEAMRWTVTGSRAGEMVQALCPACRRAGMPEAAATAPTAQVRTRSFEPVLPRTTRTPSAERSLGATAAALAVSVR